MKRTYIRPFITMNRVETKAIICTSVYLKSGGAAYDIDYGGIDGEGTIEVSSRSSSFWDDSEE